MPTITMGSEKYTEKYTEKVGRDLRWNSDAIQMLNHGHYSSQ